MDVNSNEKAGELNEIVPYRWNWFQYCAGVLTGFVVAMMVALSAPAFAAERSGSKMTEQQKKEQATNYYRFCTKRELVSEIYRPAFGLILARDTHIVDDEMKGSPEKIGTSLCILDLEGDRHYGSLEEVSLALDRKDLVRVRADVLWDRHLDDEHRLLRPFARDYFEQLSDDFHAAFPANKQGYKVTSLLRTTSEQKALAKRKLSPLDCSTEWYCSAHTSGTAFDISLRGLSKDEEEWLRMRLRADIARLRVLAIKEGKSGCFHVQVVDPKFYQFALKILDTPVPGGEPPKDPATKSL